ncbi:FKBP-type peptidyl-prolyl cis-trans isomerase [candidate division KSB1 bacterium]|nr:FKBP-type peptidyl-prolyl cis-trans isomerase [candidate division KSB1 bacterium]
MLSLNCSTSDDDGVGVVPVTDADKYSYAIGYQVGTQIKELGVEFNPDALAQAIRDVMDENDIQMTSDEMAAIQTKVMGELTAAQNIEREQNLAAANAFLEENAKKEGVVTLPSGLQYKVITEGTGASPTAVDNIEAHYRGTLLNGDEFDSSYSRNEPLVGRVSNFIQGWIEGLQLMKEGSKWELYIHPDLGYGAADRPGIPPNSALIFEMELIRVIK